MKNSGSSAQIEEEEKTQQDLKDFENESNKIHVYECSDSDEGNIHDEGSDNGQEIGEYVPTDTIDVRKDGHADDDF